MKIVQARRIERCRGVSFVATELCRRGDGVSFLADGLLGFVSSRSVRVMNLFLFQGRLFLHVLSWWSGFDVSFGWWYLNFLMGLSLWLGSIYG
jgi:hypothetical protein